MNCARFASLPALTDARALTLAREAGSNDVGANSALGGLQVLALLVLARWVDSIDMAHDIEHGPRAGQVIVLATLDTKGHEAAYVRDLLVGCGVSALLADVGSFAPSVVKPDIGREEILGLVGVDPVDLATAGDRGAAVSAAARGAAAWVAAAHREGRIAGLLAIGGSAGTTIGTAAMRALSLGVPKVMVSTLASGQVRHYVGDKDIVMLNSIVDLVGLNRVTREVLSEAARAMAGMVLFERPARSGKKERPLVAATMFGVTTPCVEHARQLLEQAGCEVLVFHATGSGGQAMESLIDEGLIAGVLDITTTELADELVGGVLSAGSQRLTAAGRRGVAQVVSVGATDMVNFHDRPSVPARFADRTFNQHNPNVTLMRTTADECADRCRYRPQARGGAWAGRSLSAGPRSLGDRPRGPAIRRSRGAAGIVSVTAPERPRVGNP